MIKLKDLITEVTTKAGFEAIKQITGGKTSQFGNITKADWVNHHKKGIIFGGGGKWKNGIFTVEIFGTGKGKYKVEFFKSMADQFGLSQHGKKEKPAKVVKNVEGPMLHSTFKGYLGI